MKQHPKEKYDRRRISFIRVIFILLLGFVSLVFLSNVYQFLFVQNLLNIYDLWSDETLLLSSSQQIVLVDGSHDEFLSTTPESGPSLMVDLLNENETMCDLINTQIWLKGPRFGNLHETLPDDAVRAMLFLFNRSSLLNSMNEQLPVILGQSICYPQSPFLTVSHPIPQSPLDGSDPIVRLWAVRLVYLTFHYHQHRWAFPEAERRWGVVNDATANLNCPSQADLTEQYGVGKFDYECPDAKFLLVTLGGNGLGANVRGGMVPAMMLGLMTNRVVLFMNNIQATNATRYMQAPWPLASCPRKDYQCFFWPITPCVLTESDVDSAYHLSFAESRKLVKRSELPEHAEHYKVWVWSTVSQPIPGFHQEAADVLHAYAQTLVSNIRSEDETAEYLDLLNRAVELVRDDDGLRVAYHYAAASYKIQHTAAIYIMRPHPVIAQILHEIVSKITPPDLNPEHALGLPVRASDKCLGESECLTFDEHMTVVGEMWQRHMNDTADDTVTNVTVVFTTEATSVVEEQQAFEAERRIVSRYPHLTFSFLTNEHDVTPNSGFMKDIDQEKNDADTIMIAALSSLKAQLLPRVSIGNCCSNFHVLLNDFLSEGCGAASHNTFHCIQESEDPLLAVCCGWHKDCQKRKEQLRLELFGNTSMTVNATDDPSS